MIDVSVIIPSFNRREALKRCLDYLFNQDYPKERYEIIVVDDGSQDGTKDEIDSLDPPCRLTYFYQSNSGPHLARNLGLSKADGEVILFIDSDVFAPAQLIREHMRLHKMDERLIVSGPLTETKRLDEDFKDFAKRRFLAIFDLSGPSLITSNLSVRKRYFLEIGGFDEDFEGYGWHDWELARRLSKIGLKAKRNRSALVYHLAEERISSLEEVCRKRFERGRNAALYLKKHRNLATLLAIHPHLLIYDSLLGLLVKGGRIPRRWLLIHKYAEGLRTGLVEYNLRTILRWM